jgi:hypothetical protein
MILNNKATEHKGDIMNKQLASVLAQVGLGVLVSTVSVQPLKQTGKAPEKVRVPRGFVESYAVAHQPTVAGVNAEWVWDGTSDMALKDVTLPGEAVSYGEALHARRGQPGETPSQYLGYLSAVARVRRYAEGLLKEWEHKSMIPATLSRGNGAMATVRLPDADANRLTASR